MAKKVLDSRTARDLMQSAVAGVELPKSELVIPPAVKREPLDNWQVVVVGAIDARQISPQWLHMIGSIDDAELEAGKKTLTVFATPKVTIGEGVKQVSPNFVQFDVGMFAVTVVPDRWIIQTAVERNRARLVDVSANVFRKLNEIAIGAYGINKNWVVKLKDRKARQVIGEQLLKTDLALPPGDLEGQLTYKSRQTNSETNIQLSPSPIEETWLQVNYNRHHQISGQTGYFDVGKMIIDDAEAGWQAASEYGSDLEKSINRGA